MQLTSCVFFINIVYSVNWFINFVKIKKMKKILITLSLIMLAGGLWAQTLTLEINGVEKVSGNLLIAFFNSSDSFLKKPCYTKSLEVKDTSLFVKCDGLAAGKYAITMFHDENLNEKVDLGEMGIPTEKYGFSNNPELYGLPEFNTCSFSFQKDTTVAIQLK